MILVGREHPFPSCPNSFTQRSKGPLEKNHLYKIISHPVRFFLLQALKNLIYRRVFEIFISYWHALETLHCSLFTRIWSLKDFAEILRKTAPRSLVVKYLLAPKK